jgi:selenocysteine lyase/cysteine desulfurase
VRPAANEPVGHRFEHGTQQHELLAGFVAAVEYVESLGWEAIVGHETQLGRQFLDGVPDAVELYGLRTMEGRVPTFAFNLPGRSSEEVAVELAAREIAVWHGDYYAVEIMKQLGLEGTGAVRAGFVHYNTPAEVDRLLTALTELA